MKKLVLLLAMGAVLAGCNKNTDNNNVEADTQQAASHTTEVSVVADAETASHIDAAPLEESKSLKFAAKDGTEYTLSTTDNFQTATLTDNTGKSYDLKEAVAASGMRLTNDDGVVVALKGDEGSVEIEKDKIIEIKEVK